MVGMFAQSSLQFYCYKFDSILRSIYAAGRHIFL